MSKIEESYVGFETARMLKEAGFDAPCLCCYTSDGEKEETRVPLNHNFGLDYSRPTQALAARWLREKHRIVVNVAFIPPSVNGDIWQYFIEKMDNMVWIGDFEPSERRYKTYEEALEEGLKRSLELIKK